MAIHFKNGKSSNMKALKIHEEVRQIAALEGPGADLNDIFFRVDGAKDKKRRLYGNPHATSSQTTDTDDTAQPSVHKLQAIVESEREARRALESKVDSLERLISRLAAVSQDPSSRRDEDSNSHQSTPPA